VACFKEWVTFCSLSVPWLLIAPVPYVNREDKIILLCELHDYGYNIII
jgi:hypothetical protein